MRIPVADVLRWADLNCELLVVFVVAYCVSRIFIFVSSAINIETWYQVFNSCVALVGM